MASQVAAVRLLLLLVVLIRAHVEGISSPSLPISSAPPLPGVNPVGALYDDISNILIEELPGEANQCIEKPTDWHMAFNYTSDPGFLVSCMAELGDVPRRLCTKAEIKFYMQTLVNQTTSDSSANLFQPNINCSPNSTTWVSGCEPGWHCSLDPSIVQADLRDTTTIPLRTSSCKPCCDGFFCPEGLTCMLPCPLGSYCQRASYNTTTGLCEPYNYQLPRGRPQHQCGGPNMWGRIETSPEIFCPAGSYCPTSTVKKSCPSGHYCRTGSTYETRCSKLITCDENTSTQNIHAYGIMVIAGLIALLLIIYNCSDQMISLRERRRAKARERAMRSVQVSVHARHRWQSAVDSVLKHTNRSATNLSHRNSGHSDLEERRMLDETDDNNIVVQSDLSPAPYLGENTEQDSTQPTTRTTSAAAPGNKRSYKDLIEDEQKPSGWTTTNTQIFRYAYAQIQKEKEKTHDKQMNNFSRVIEMASKYEIKKRPPIEVAFKDLTLTLKGKNKRLLKCLNGKIIPGRITAVMGPSGAGKTTLLSALAGKTTGCKIDGLILINGATESIHSYRKIVGYVPQDDIVHGNLTVEENLWFSARCRLSAKLRRADRVLIVERVLENLGLQEVRDSLVGTVEKRGISGGQRKRVNVGLELVMEPSLLFLDEPTSGLDSSSSRLLLQALRHEALVGVNICMVVHQPSYALFRMFDDLILLAKGGLMVYQGSVRCVEDYFERIGIKVPERVNPPDHYIDILEGLGGDQSTRSAAEGPQYKQLPLIWMIQNGYTVPEDMQQAGGGGGLMTPMSSGSGSLRNGGDTFAGELWQDISSSAHQRQDYIRNNFLWERDLSLRSTPNFVLQYKYFLGRICKQRLREARLQATDYLILLIAGACLGAITKIDDNTFGATNYSYTVIAVSLLCQIASLRTFSMDKLQYWRESASGISSLAHFLAKDTIDLFNVVIKPAVYLSMFYFFTNPRSSFYDNYIVLVSLVYCVTGMGYVFAIFLQPGSAQLFSVLLPVCLSLIATQSFKKSTPPFMKFLGNLSYPKWVLEAFVIANAKRYYGVWLIQRCMVLVGAGFSLHGWWKCIVTVLVIGAISRVVAFIGMVVLKKK